MFRARLEEQVYSYFRRLRNIGRIRAWYAAKADRRSWDEERYPPPPEMRHPDPLLFEGSWADVSPSYIRVNRPSPLRGKIIESRGKLNRLRKRRKARKYRASQKRTGKYESIMETLEIMGDKELMAAFRQGVQDIAEGRVILFQDLDDMFVLTASTHQE